MKYNPEKHHRKSVRLKEYDYSQAGAYFVTICTHNKKSILGDVVNGEMRLSRYGEIVKHEWLETGVIRSNVEMDVFVVMPNHIHGIIMLSDEGRGTARRAPTVEQFSRPVIGSLPTIVRSFKSAVTKHINIMRNTPRMPIWQRNYYEHIIRNDDKLDLIREYITNNPLQWQFDRENPERIPAGANARSPYDKQWACLEEAMYGKSKK